MRKSRKFTPTADEAAEQGQREVVRGAAGAVHQPALGQASQEQIDARDVGQQRAQATQCDGTRLSGHGLQDALLRRWRALEPILEEGQIKLVEQSGLDSLVISGVDTSFAYNAWGDLTSAADRDNGTTTHTYDAGSRLVRLTVPAGGGFGVVHPLTYDALGRPATRDLNANTTYAYVGVSRVSYAVSSGGSTTYGLLDASLSRLALHTGGTTAWTSFDLHGNLVGATASGSGTIVSALRYDAYGATLDSYSAGSGATETPWRYQGRLDLSPDVDEPLYDYGARRYRPSTGAFTQLDTYPGSAADPRSMNRYLYAHANPTTLIDPTGHCAQCGPMLDGYVPTPKAGKNAKTTAAAARAATSSSSSWAPASATNTANTADALARAAQQAKAKTTTPTAYHWQGVKSLRTPFSTPGVYQPNPSNLPWVGAAATGSPPPGKFGALFAAIDAAPERSPYAGVHPLDAALAGALVVGGGSLVLLIARAGIVAMTSGAGTACIQYCDDVAAALEGFAGAPPRLPTSSTATTGSRAIGSEAYHYTRSSRAAAIAADGLPPGRWVTDAGNLTPIQAQIELALPPNRLPRDLIVTIDVGGLRAAGYEVPSLTRVSSTVRSPDGRVYTLGGGGYEAQFPYAIPSTYLRFD